LYIIGTSGSLQAGQAVRNQLIDGATSRVTACDTPTRRLV